MIDMINRLQAAYDKVAFAPEQSPTGLIDLIKLRNVVGEALIEVSGPGSATTGLLTSAKATGVTNAAAVTHVAAGSICPRYRGNPWGFRPAPLSLRLPGGGGSGSGRAWALRLDLGHSG